MLERLHDGEFIFVCIVGLRVNSLGSPHVVMVVQLAHSIVVVAALRALADDVEALVWLVGELPLSSSLALAVDSHTMILFGDEVWTCFSSPARVFEAAGVFQGSGQLLSFFIRIARV